MNENNKIIKPELKYYSIELEAMVPATLKYRILANSPEEALEGILKSQPIQQPKLIFAAMKRISAQVFNYGTRILKYSKKF